MITPLETGEKYSGQLIPITLPVKLVNLSALAPQQIKLNVAGIISDLFFHYEQPIQFERPELDVYDSEYRLSSHAREIEKLFENFTRFQRFQYSQPLQEESIPTSGDWHFNVHYDQGSINRTGPYPDELVQNASHVAYIFLFTYCTLQQDVEKLFNRDKTSIEQEVFAGIYDDLRRTFGTI